MKIGIKVGDVMTRNFIFVKPETSLFDCAKIMIKRHVGSLIIKEKEELKGIITQRDIIWAITKKTKKDLHEIMAEDVMPKKIITIKPNADLFSAMQKMKRTKYRRLPVVIKKKVIGMLTVKDILKIEPALFDIAKGYFQIVEEPQKIKRKESSEKFQIGICEECGNTEMVYKLDGRMICEGCIEAM